MTRPQRRETVKARWWVGARKPRAAKLALALAIVASSSSYAWSIDVPALDITGLGSGRDYYQGASYCTGFRFTANEDVTVTALGFYDDQKNGIVGGHDVGIYDVVTKQLLATATVVPSDPLTGFFRYHALAAPVTLPANRDYFAQAVTLTDHYALAPDIVVDPAITFIGIAGDDGFTPHTDLHYPTDILMNDFVGDFGPSFKIAKCPGGRTRDLGATARAGAPPGESQLASPTRRKAAVKCQQVIAKAVGKSATGELKALDACANAALSCVESKADKADCFAKAGQVCAKQLDAVASNSSKLATKIVSAKSCNTDLRLTDLLAEDGLGFGREADFCQSEFDLDVCSGLDPLAQCLVRTHGQAAGRLYGKARPRTAELLGLLPGAALPPVEGLESFAGCGTCTSASDPKGVEQCGHALTKATESLLADLDARFASCAQGVLACVQVQADKPKCLPAATSKCTDAAAKVTAALAKFAAQADKKCGGAAIDFTQLTAPAGLNLDALATECAKFGLAAPSSAATLVECLQRRVQCTASELVQHSNARTDGFAVNDVFGALTADLTATCPDSAPALPNSTVNPRFLFGSLVKFLKTVQHVGGATTMRLGAPPLPSGASFQGFPRIGGTRRVFLGGITKIPFTYRITPRARATESVAEPPSLIVAAVGGDGSGGDYVEVALDPPAGQSDVDDEVDLVLQDSLPTCAFTLVFATRDGDVVSDYTPATLVVDPDPCP